LRRRSLSALRAVVSGSAFIFLATLSAADAAVVHGVSSYTSAHATEIRIHCEGTPTFRSGHAGSNHFLLEIDDAAIGARVPRLLPVMDERVHGVAVIRDVEQRRVRIRVDLAPGVKADLDSSSEAGFLVVRALRTTSDGAGVHADVAPAPAIEPAIEVPDATPSRPQNTETKRGRGAARDRPLIVIDPGHGGKDPGAGIWTGEYEKDIVLAIATTVAERLRKRLDVDVVMTRTDDVFVTLKERRAMVRRWDADLFISIHANASHNEGARGVETYYAPRKSGGEVRGRGLARSIQRQLVRHLGMRYKTVRDLGVKEGRFYVLRDNDVPSVLVEAAFLTHREEGIRIRSESYRDKAAEGIVGGIAEFLASPHAAL